MFCNRLNLILKLFIILSLVLGGSMIWYCLLQDNSSITQTKKEITYLDTRLQYFSDYYSTEYCDENFTVVLIEYVYNTEKCAIILNCDINLGYFSRYAPEFKTLTSNDSAYTYCLETYKWVNENRDLFTLRQKKNRRLLGLDGGIKLSIKDQNDESAFYRINVENYSKEINEKITISIENVISQLNNQNIKFEDLISFVNE